MENIKHNQHYVFQSYLKAWQNDKGQVYCLRNRKKVFATNTININSRRDFYGLKTIGKIESLFYEIYFSNLPKENKEAIDVIFNTLKYISNSALIAQNVLNIAKNNNSCYTEEVIREAEKMEKLTRKHMNDFIENILCETEEELSHFIKLLLVGNITFYNTNYNDFDDSNLKFKFLYNLCIQYFRTNKMRLRNKESIKMEIERKYEGKKLLNELDKAYIKLLRSVDIDALFPVFMVVHANTCALGMYKQEYGLKVIENATDVPFITNDQPVINLKTNYSTKDIVKELELYYPVSPQKAIVISKEVGAFFDTIDDVAFVKWFNDKIADASEENLIANEQKVLNSYIEVS